MIPVWLIRAVPYLLAVAGVLAALGFAYHTGSKHTETKYELLISKEHERAEQAIAAEMAERLKMEQDAREKEQRHQNEIERVRQDASDQITRAKSGATAAIASANRLREQANRTAARCATGTASASSGAATGSAPAASPGLVLADVLGRIDARAGELAEFADRAAIAGSACERSYDSLRR